MKEHFRFYTETYDGYIQFHDFDNMSEAIAAHSQSKECKNVRFVTAVLYYIED